MYLEEPKSLPMKLIAFLFCFFHLVAFSQEDQFLSKKGLLDKKKWSLRDSALINQLNKISSDSSYLNVDKAERYARIAHHGSQEIEYAEGEIMSLRNRIRCKIYLNEFDSAQVFVDEILSKLKPSTKTEVQVRAFEVAGTVYDYQGKYDQAVDYYLKATEVAEKQDSSLATVSYHNIGLIYKRLQNIDKAYEYFLRCERISRKNKDLRTLTSSLNNLGNLKKNQQEFDGAFVFFEEGLSLAREIDDVKLEGDILANMSTAFFESGNHKKGMEYFNKSLKWIKQTGSHYQLAISYINFAFNLKDFNRLQEAEAIADTALYYSKLCKNYEFIMESYWISGDIKAARGKFAAGFADMLLAYNYKDSMNIATLNGQITELEDSYERKQIAIADSLEKVQLKKEFETDQKLSDEKLWFKDLLLIISIFVLALVGIGALLLFKTNKKVKAKNKIVEEQHKEITDSINYAQRIQSAMISNDEAWKLISPHRSIFFKPKDVVSGDFHWAHFNEEKKLAIWCVADCTGHGVPGAFMSVLGSSFLTDIIVDSNITEPAKVLDLLREKVISALMKKGEDQAKDGMDIALCVWEKKTNTLHFAGANNSLYLLRRRENPTEESFKRTIDDSKYDHILYEVPPNKMPIGSYSGNESPFTSVSLKLAIDDTLILSTDGYADQFGGENGKKLKSRPFKEFLLSIQTKTMSDQSNLIEQHFDDWKGSHEQLDDVCVVGIRIS